MGAYNAETMEEKMIFGNQTKEERRGYLNQLSMRTGVEEFVYEKDWWVSQVLRALFSLPYAHSLSFKGGTSLSKAWGLIDRFSEDVDLGIDREFLGFGGELSKTQISDKLRRVACSFVRETLQNDLRNQLIANGIKSENFVVRVNVTSVTTTDPEIIEIEYDSSMGEHRYLQHVVKVEVSGRSMHEPVEECALKTMISETHPEGPFAEEDFAVMAVVPERTFLEKAMLLHEEFAKPITDIRTERMSRHLYDIYRIMQTPIAERALLDEPLYRSVLEHRRKFVGLRGFDYDTLYSDKLSLEIPADVINLWHQDYDNMCRTMIYGEHPSWNELIERMRELNDRIRRLGYLR